jgi:hypothetical protein
LEEGENTDITFVVNGTHIKAHRFVLTSRSDYFEQQILAGRWKNRDIVFINNSLVDSSVFYRIIEWLYTGQVKFAVSQYEDALRLCKQCRLDDLEKEIQSAFIKADSFGKKYRISEWAKFQVWKFLHLQKLAHRKKSLPPKGRRPAGGKAFLPTG